MLLGIYNESRVLSGTISSSHGRQDAFIVNLSDGLASLADKFPRNHEQACLHTHSCRRPHGRALRSMASYSESSTDMVV